MSLRRLVPAALVAALAAIAAVSASATPSASRTIDRTFTCAIQPRGGAYELESRAHAGTRSGGSWAKLPYAALRAGLFTAATGNLLAWVTAGRPAPATTVDQEFETFDVNTLGTIGIRAELCRASKQRVVLGRSHLRGGAATPLGDEYECGGLRRVLVRVRAILASPSSLGGTELLTLHVPVRKAELAARTLSGKPLVYAEVLETGKARLFTATGCSRG